MQRQPVIKSASIHFQNTANAEAELRASIGRLVTRNGKLRDELKIYRRGFWLLSGSLLLLLAVLLGVVIFD